jgi:hypothetical protein
MLVWLAGIKAHASAGFGEHGEPLASAHLPVFLRTGACLAGHRRCLTELLAVAVIAA